MRRAILVLAVVLLSVDRIAAEPANWTIRDSVVYARADNAALTIDIYTPSTPNGAAVLQILSGGWVSGKLSGNPGNSAEFLRRGYTLIAISHGSTPRYTIDEIIPQLKRAIRFIRLHAKEYGIDPGRVGVTGGSAGGHLSLMLATTGDDGDPKAKDPVDRQSCRVQAVGSFFPPTDFLNYGKEGENAVGRGILANYKGAFAFHELSENKRWYEPITDEAKILQIAKAISPIYHITSDTPPVLLIHGDADTLVPLQQSRSFLQKLKAAGGRTKLIIKPDLAHGWKDRDADYAAIADWFDRQLAAN